MTVLAESTGVAIYTGNGSTVFFEYGYTLDDDSGVLVFVDGVLDTGDYQLQSTGVQFFVAPPVGARIVIARFTDITQLRDWVPFGPFPAEKTEGAADKLITLKQEGAFRRNMNLYAVQDADSVLIVNDKGTDADIPLWHHSSDEAGMFACIVDTQIPPDGSPTSDADSTVYIQFTDGAVVPPDEPTAIIVDRPGLKGQVMTEMNFSALGNIPERSRSHPVGGITGVHDFTAFFCTRWTADEPGPMIDSDVMEFYLAKRPATFPEQYYFGWRIFDASISPRTEIASGTFEVGNIIGDTGLISYYDWVVFLWSLKDMHVPDPGRFTGYLVNMTRGVETSFSSQFNDASAGELGMRIDTERGISSRMGFLNNYTGDVTGVFGFFGTMGAHGFHFGQALDFEQPSERAKICTPTDLVDHGVGGVNIFGEQMAYYTQGNPQLNTGYINTGNPSIFNQADFASEVDAPPYNYPVTTHPMGDWEYADWATAKASGDAWQEGDQIFLTEGNQVMKYRSALAVDGYCGLVHFNPFFSILDQYSGAAVIESHAEGSDPSTWGWTVLTDGVENTDWALDVQGGRGRIAKLTTNGSVRMESPHSLAVGDESTFAIFERINGDNNNFTENQIITLKAGDAVNASTSVTLLSSSAQIPVSPPFDTWAFQMIGEYENTTLPWADEHTLFLYTQHRGTEVWSSIWSEIGPMLFHIAFGVGAGANLMDIQCNLLTDGSAGNFQWGTVLMGRLIP